jgi:hypothetical protein
MLSSSFLFLLIILFINNNIILINSFPFEIPNDFIIILSWNEHISKSWDQKLSKSFYYKYAGYTIPQQLKSQYNNNNNNNINKTLIYNNKIYSSHDSKEIIDFQNKDIIYSTTLQFNIYKKSSRSNNNNCIPFQYNDIQSCSDILNLLPLRYMSSLRIHFAHRMEINYLWNIEENQYETIKGNNYNI